MLNAFLVALAVFICVGGAELIGFTMLTVRSSSDRW